MSSCEPEGPAERDPDCIFVLTPADKDRILDPDNHYLGIPRRLIDGAREQHLKVSDDEFCAAFGHAIRLGKAEDHFMMKTARLDATLRMIERGRLEVIKIATDDGVRWELHKTWKTKCFVATAVFGDAGAPEVMALKRWRDRHLAPTPWGRGLIWLYWRVGPLLAEAVRGKPRLAAAAARVIRALMRVIGV